MPTERSRTTTLASEPTRLATLLRPQDRDRVEAAGAGLVDARHRESIDELHRDLRLARVDAVLVSVDQCDAKTAQGLARCVREFPLVPAYALLGTDVANAVPTALALGRAGVRRLIDVRSPAGWNELRHLLAQERQQGVESRLRSMFREALPAMNSDARRFFDALAAGASRLRTVRELCRVLGVRAPSVTSRFYRAGVPAPKRFLAMTRLVRAAALLENPGLSISQVAYRLGYSSPQCFNRHVRRWSGQTAATFRSANGLDRMLQVFRRELIDPYVTQLEQLRPYGGPRVQRPPVAGGRPTGLARAA
ncbi:MAG: helix-turn-helix transcriptional regulator [Gemmatimonadaceae bacterium]|nr:helix-turn-helix transcriptional regulator [Gemmatimonadaceae bacterium]